LFIDIGATQKPAATVLFSIERLIRFESLRPLAQPLLWFHATFRRRPAPPGRCAGASPMRHLAQDLCAFWPIWAITLRPASR
jgi:hypothetical protein